MNIKLNNRLVAEAECACIAITVEREGRTGALSYLL